ncbi:MAG: hypothetical protein IPN74_06720 [Haliscomenobacter sp.]|nr:hypothetical protein [Haliscomenobacter sp.]
MEVALDEALAEVVVVFRQVGTAGRAIELQQQAGFAAGVVVPVLGFDRLIAGTCRCPRLMGARGGNQEIGVVVGAGHRFGAGGSGVEVVVALGLGWSLVLTLTTGASITWEFFHKPSFLTIQSLHYSFFLQKRKYIFYFLYRIELRIFGNL